jgi:hypothetical protein
VRSTAPSPPTSPQHNSSSRTASELLDIKGSSGKVTALGHGTAATASLSVVASNERPAPLGGGYRFDVAATCGGWASALRRSSRGPVARGVHRRARDFEPLVDRVSGPYATPPWLGGSPGVEVVTYDATLEPSLGAPLCALRPLGDPPSLRAILRLPSFGP